MKRFVLFCSVILLGFASCSDPKTEIGRSTGPEILTEPVSSIRQTTAIGSGYITQGNPENYHTKGICWSTEPNPTIDDFFAESQTDVEKHSYLAALDGLTLSTMYYVRAYVSDGVHVYYGNELSFTTKDMPLEGWCVIDKVASITPSSAVVTVEIADNGGKDIVELGLCYSANSTAPVIETDKSIKADEAGVIQAILKMEQLLQNTNYFVRPYFKTADASVTYGDAADFTTLNFIVTQGPSTAKLQAVWPGYKTAYMFGEVVDDAGSPTTERGVCWGLTDDVTVETGDYKTVGSGKGAFNTLVDGLDKGTTYYMRAYAKNDDGTFYGLPVQFTTKTGSALPQATLADMIHVEAGEFTMGYDGGGKALFKNTPENAEVQHRVILTKNFYMNRYITTIEQMCAFLNSYPFEQTGQHSRSILLVAAGSPLSANPAFFNSATTGNNGRAYSFKSPDEAGTNGLFIPRLSGYERYPVGNVNPACCFEYCRWLSAELGVTVRLPTEAEWEFAARGGKKSQGFQDYAGSNNANDVAVRGTTGPAKVGTKLPNELGLYDMCGNMFEFCADIMNTNMSVVYYDGVVDPCYDPDPSDIRKTDRVMRGGCFRNFDDDKTKDYQVLGRRGRVDAGGATNSTSLRIVFDNLPTSFD